MTDSRTAGDPLLSRQLWHLLEPVHATVYFAREARQHFEAVGLKGFWMGYFASRAAALGPVGPDVVGATFFVFHPRMVARAIPDAWHLSTPETVLEARAELADATLRRALGDLADGQEVTVAAELAAKAASEAPPAGRPLGAAHAALPQPAQSDPLRRLWWAASALREHRGDGHVAALVAAGVDPCAALVLAAANGATGPDGATLLQTSRRWADDEWAEARHRLEERGWLDQGGSLTAEGSAAHQSIEDTTDRAALAAYQSLSHDHVRRLKAALKPLATRIVETGAFPYPNPIGLDPTN